MAQSGKRLLESVAGTPSGRKRKLVADGEKDNPFPTSSNGDVALASAASAQVLASALKALPGSVGGTHPF